MSAVEMSVTPLDLMGTDLTVVNAARVSFAKSSGFEGEPGLEILSAKDTKLIRYLAKHNHFSTFTHCTAQFHVKAPVFVARQLVKHQVGLSWNEVSRRYVDAEPEYWLPKVLKQRPDGSIKQGAGEAHDSSEGWIECIREHTRDAISGYADMIADGVAPEQARMVLPLNVMTEWWWTGSLAAWARVCKLRLDPHAQEETREVAQMISDEMRAQFPISWPALMGE